MKRLKGVLGILLILCIVLTSLLSVPVFAGGTAALLYIRWVEYTADGKITFVNVTVENESVMPGMKANVIFPDGTLHESEYNHYTDQSLSRGKVRDYVEGNRYVKHITLASDGKNYGLVVGTYKLSPDFDVPEGYEFDDTLVSRNELSVTITQKDIDSYRETEKYGAGNVQWVIDVPVKEKGKPSKLLSTPPVLKLYVRDEAIGISDGSVYCKTMGFEMQYSENESSGFKTFSDSYFCRFDNVDALKNGKTYFFRARGVRKNGSEMVYSPWSETVQAKVSKGQDSKPSEEENPTGKENSRSSSSTQINATITPTKTIARKGKKSVVKIKSDSGTKLTVKGKNARAKNKKYVKIKNGKTAKLTFSKKAVKGKYTFTVTSPEVGVKTITVRVK